jgi:hypothetical protein
VPDSLCSVESFPLLHPPTTHRRIPTIVKLDRYLCPHDQLKGNSHGKS